MTSASAVDDGQWHLVTLTAAGSTQTLYLDGSQIGDAVRGSCRSPGRRTTTSAPGYLGGGWPDEQYYRHPAAYPEYFDGDISDVAFWTRQLTAAEVQALYADGTTRRRC